MRRGWLFLLIVAVALWYVSTHLTEIALVGQTVRHAVVPWLIVSLALQVAYYACYIAEYRRSFAVVGIRRPFSRFVAPVFGSLFVNVVAPSGGTAGSALIVEDAVLNGSPGPAAAAATVLGQATDYAAATAVISIGLASLLATGRLTAWEVVGAVVVFAIAAGFAVVMAVAVRSEHALLGSLSWVAARWRGLARRVRFVHAPEEAWVGRTSRGFRAAALAALRQPARMLGTLAIGVAGHACSVASMLVLLPAFGQAPRVGAAFAAYAVVLLLWIAAPVPGGIALAEASAAAVLASFGVSAPGATAVALTFRGLDFWLPLGIGFALLRRVRGLTAVDAEGREAFSAQAASLLAALLGVANVLTAVTPSLLAGMRVLRPVLPFALAFGGHLGTIAAGIALLVLSVGLWQRRRLAWGGAVAMLAITIVAHILRPDVGVVLALLYSAALAWLIAARRTFDR